MSDEYSEPWPAEDEAAEVVRAYENASQLRPDDAQTHFDHGLAFMELGSGLERHAVEAFESAVRLRPAWAQAHTQLGYAYASAGRRDDAIAEYGRALELSPMTSTRGAPSPTRRFYRAVTKRRNKPG